MRVPKLRFKINIDNLIFAIALLLFFFSQNQTPFRAVNYILAMVEAFKIKYIFAFFASIFYFLESMGKKKIYKTETKYYCASVAVLVIMSLLLGTLKGRENDLLNETLYLIVPIVFAFCLINAKGGNVEKCFDIYFDVILCGFLITNLRNFNIANIMSINFSDSYSPFESGISYAALMLTFYYKTKGNNFRMIASAIMCILSFKRLAIACLVFILLLLFRIKRREGQSTKNLRFVLMVIFCIFPFILQFIYSDTFETLFNTVTGLNFSEFVMGRYEYMNVAFDSYSKGGGLGSVRLYLTKYFDDFYVYNDIFINADLHCDIARFYLECSFIGLFAVVFSYFNSAKSKYSLLIMTFNFILATGTHMWGYGSAMYWILFYMLIYYFNKPEFTNPVVIPKLKKKTSIKINI